MCSHYQTIDHNTTEIGRAVWRRSSKNKCCVYCSSIAIKGDKSWSLLRIQRLGRPTLSAVLRAAKQVLNPTWKSQQRHCAGENLSMLFHRALFRPLTSYQDMSCAGMMLKQKTYGIDRNPYSGRISEFYDCSYLIERLGIGLTVLYLNLLACVTVDELCMHSTRTQTAWRIQQSMLPSRNV